MVLGICIYSCNLTNMDLELELDITELESLAGQIENFGEVLKKTARDLAIQTHLHIIEEASNKLHTRRESYIENLHSPQMDNSGSWVIRLDSKAVWIEDGMEPHSMVMSLLGDNPKIAKDGSLYRIIPFKHNKDKGSNGEAQQILTNSIKQVLRELRIPFQAPERKSDGTPKSGLIHKIGMDTPNRPPGAVATDNSTNNPKFPKNQHGFGHGAIGEPMQGNTGIPFLKGLRIYQTPLFNPDGTPKLGDNGKQSASKDMMTFRVVSSKHIGSKWNYPGIEGTHFFDEAYQWAENKWETEIVPSLLAALD